ncbi:unnamed protein product [Rotaria sordida]|uniref:Uncharacterized protein n=1 Tax=Rotaria sordida TaxID=392033 RepID=A0A820EBH7_9BILA|nr:unnamed protein product [Rotaria sordida]
MIDRLSIISSSDCILIEPVEELCERIKQPSTLPLLLALIDFANYLAKVNKWILLLMNSIAQRKSIRMAIWGLNCLMLSTCPSHKTTNAL